MRAKGSRRQVLTGAGASLGALAWPLLARAQTPPEAFGPDDLRRVLGPALPPEVRAVLPGEVFQAGEFVASLLELEAQAKALRLPPSRLSVGEQRIPADLDTLYELALPRLVALIDRAELRNLGLADRAGELLAKLHATQHVAPANLGGLGLPVAGERPLRLDPGSDEAAALPLPGIEAAQVDPPTIDLPEPAPAQAAVEPALPPIAVGRSLRFADLAGEYAAMFERARLRPQHGQSANWHLTMMRQAERRYAAVGRRSGVPWYFIAAIHGLEASFNFRAHYHNGDYPLTQRTRQVPAGRPTVWLPPSAWEDSAADALRLMGFAGASDWSLARTLYRLEAFNGFGYRRLGKPSPYLWSFSTNYERGKFVADGRYSATARSQQCGAAVMLKLLADAGEIELA